MFIRKIRLVSVAAGALALSACVVAPYPRQVAYGGPVYGQPGYGGPVVEDGATIVVDVAPPAPYVEVVPVLPYPGALWIGGYWGWQSNRHAWVPGRWDRPRAGYAYRPHAWVQIGGRWHLRGGGWVRG